MNNDIRAQATPVQELEGSRVRLAKQAQPGLLQFCIAKVAENMGKYDSCSSLCKIMNLCNCRLQLQLWACIRITALEPQMHQTTLQRLHVRSVQTMEIEVWVNCTRPSRIGGTYKMCRTWN